MQDLQNNPRKPLLRIRSLKQYFPLKTKGLYVKANDGITLDIYEGETLGLVGESGCGKSTFGRTLLQLYKQTDGRTMYYGRSLYDLAPKYVEKTIRDMDKNRKKLAELEQKRDAVEREYNAMPDGKEKYQKRNELDAARKAANDIFLDMANILGGFIMAEDTQPVIHAFSNVYKISVRLRKENLALEEANLELADAEFNLKKTKENGKNSTSEENKVQKAINKTQEIRNRIESIRKELEQAEKQIDKMREPYKNNAEFRRLEEFRDDGIDLARLDYEEIRHLRTDLQMIFQDPYSSLNPRMTVGQIISEGLLAHNYFRKNNERMQEYILKVMDDAGLQPYFIHRYPHQFSGGQRQRIGIARSLAVQPRFVVCDEAVSALDVSIQSQILNLLQDLKEQQHLTYLFITHDMSVVKYISNRIGVMYLGNIVELADSQEIFDHPLHPYTEALMNAIPTTDVINGKEMQILEGDIPSPINPPDGCKFHTRCKYCTEICKHQIPEWREAAPNHFAACHHILGNRE